MADPITITGLVLGIVPLLISAVENYETTFEPFVIYCRYEKEMRSFTTRLDTQRTIFQNTCQLLLMEVDQNLTDILNDPKHVSRNDAELSARMQERLNTSYSAIESTIAVVIETLRKVIEETAGFREVLDAKKSDRFSHFRRKIKISFSKPRLKAIVDELKVQNDNLERLSCQIQRLNPVNQATLSSVRAITNTDGTSCKWHISDIQTAQKAAIRLSEALSSRWSCDPHVGHDASLFLRLEDHCQHSACQIRFKLAVTCKQSMAVSETLCLVIESGRGESINNQEEDDTPAVTPAVTLQSTLKSAGFMGRKVRFNIPERAPPKTQNSAASGAAEPNLYAMEKLCNYFRQLHPPVIGGTYVGFLEKTKPVRDYVYVDRKLGPHSHPTQSASLKHIIQEFSVRRQKQDKGKTLMLARILALSVLRFHGTPWLSETWSSSDIGFLSSDPLAPQTDILESPFVHMPLADGTNRKKLSPTVAASDLAHNKALFNLGIVLIELGYGDTFENLVVMAIDDDQPPESRGKQITSAGRDRGADFLAARKLGQSVHRKINPTYKRIVEKCLDCDFGEAKKLDDVRLQSAVLSQVVDQLDICLNQWRAFNTLIS